MPYSGDTRHILYCKLRYVEGMITSSIIKVFIPASAAFVMGILFAPILTHYLYKHRVWKKTTQKIALDGKPAVEFEKIRTTIHAGTETQTPRMGGILIWGTVVFVTVAIWVLARVVPLPFMEKLDFLSRSQTWVPLFTLIAGALIGLANDFLDIHPSGERGIRLRTRLLFVTLISGFIGWWFYAKLGMDAIGIPGDGTLYLGALIVPLFILVSISLYAGGVIDGIDGLAGGIFSSAFMAYAGIAYFQNQINLAAFCATLTGAILAFLWFNIPPARFWMTETGTMGLTLTLAVIAFMTDTPGNGFGVAALPVIAFPLVVTVLSNVIQVVSKKVRGKKVFLIAPLHHHFEAVGWPSYKVTMRYWIISIVFAIIGMTIALVK
ncbi:MAG: Phospho-N-acetylmuramoyl-pentapeptide-transferase [Parcubacteria group bacterium GW2011_GWB1_57_6]|nr:MAG: Phospho-N-acetylmuramoyl-pentapeptide-transferase [Parcubacteria group bacterium GW2011_GWA1_56_13]KKW46490.1 MAG: Phospho-N-acetylmuramoyl-pentapeptide-transferase [Parcubacteria group bacterium GW2011_GWB1_57_6]